MMKKGKWEYVEVNGASSKVHASKAAYIASVKRREAGEKATFQHGESIGHSSISNFGGALHNSKARIKKI